MKSKITLAPYNETEVGWLVGQKMSVNDGITIWETTQNYQIMIDKYASSEFPPAKAPNQLLDFGKFRGRDFRSVFTQEHSYVKWCMAHMKLDNQWHTGMHQWVKYIIGEVNNQGFERWGQPRNDSQASDEPNSNDSQASAYVTASVTEGAATTTVLTDPNEYVQRTARMITARSVEDFQAQAVRMNGDIDSLKNYTSGLVEAYKGAYKGVSKKCTELEASLVAQNQRIHDLEQNLQTAVNKIRELETGLTTVSNMLVATGAMEMLTNQASERARRRLRATDETTAEIANEWEMPIEPR